MTMFIAGPDVSLNGIADRVSDHHRLVGIGSFATVCAGFDELLGVVPGAAGIGHEDGEEEPGDQGPGKKGAERLDVDEAR